ncbi:hypothetical protein ACI7RC_02525 [Brevibacillus sp. B_LB10_24]|uniref:hypothetical protein n=1 Tax=Brevibacillus sp. B_LB10_24 TaxID=3380645 RepID=UPI0038B893D5
MQLRHNEKLRTYSCHDNYRQDYYHILAMAITALASIEGWNYGITAGIGFMIVGVSLVMAAVGLESGGIVFAMISQICTGFGIGLANPTTGAIALQHARPGEEGEISAHLQFVDAFCPGLGIGIGGAFIALCEHFNKGILSGIMLALLLQLVFAIWSFIIFFRIAERKP